MDIIYFINGGLRFIFIFVRKPEGLHLGTSTINKKGDKPNVVHLYWNITTHIYIHVYLRNMDQKYLRDIIKNGYSEVVSGEV